MSEAWTLYHGSERILPVPWLGGGNPHNDYGPGFYCTRDFRLAGEWACQRGRDAYVNEYRLDAEGLVAVDLMDGSHSVLEWIALLMANRFFVPQTRIARRNRDFLLANCLPDISGADVVIGYRADDSCFSYAEDFVNNALSVADLGKALRLGNLGLQVVLTSQRAFDRLGFVCEHAVAANDYYPRFIARDAAARNAYAGGCESLGGQDDEVIATDIVRGGVSLDDARIPRMLP